MAIGTRMMRAPACVVSSCVALLFSAATARAGFEVSFYEGSELLKTVDSANGSSISFNGTVGDFSVNLTYDLLNGGMGLATAGNATIVNNDAHNARTFTIVVTEQGVLGIAGATSFAAGSVPALLGGTGSIVSAETAGKLAIGSGLIGTEYELQSGPYDAYSLAMYAGFRLVPLSTVVFSQSDGRVSADLLPEPSSLALAVAGIPCVGGIWWWQRRRTRACRTS